MYTALTIAGSDSCGGAGIQADIKTMTSLGVYASSVVTALTAQNTTGVNGIMEVTETFLKQQLDCVFSDIYPNAVKLGMLSNAKLMKTAAERLSFYEAKNLVVDPVMISTSGHRLMDDDAIETLKTYLLSQDVITTPNIPEAEVLADMKILSEEDMEIAAKRIHEELGCSVLLKGGHFEEDKMSSDYFLCKEGSRWYTNTRVNNPNTHGSGCTLSSAIAAYLARGENACDAIGHAKEYVWQAIAAGLDLGKGSGPLNHMWNIKS